MLEDAPRAGYTATDSAPDRADADPAPEVARGTELFTSAQVAVARANCGLPRGPAESPQTIGDKLALLTGASLLCAPT